MKKTNLILPDGLRENLTSEDLKARFVRLGAEKEMRCVELDGRGWISVIDLLRKDAGYDRSNAHRHWKILKKLRPLASTLCREHQFPGKGQWKEVPVVDVDGWLQIRAMLSALVGDQTLALASRAIQREWGEIEGVDTLMERIQAQDRALRRDLGVPIDGLQQGQKMLTGEVSEVRDRVEAVESDVEGIKHQISRPVSIDHRSGQVSMVMSVDVKPQHKIDVTEMIRAAFNSALSEALNRDGQAIHEANAKCIGFLGLDRSRWQPKHYGAACGYLYRQMDIDIRWVMEPYTT